MMSRIDAALLVGEEGRRYEEIDARTLDTIEASRRDANDAFDVSSALVNVGLYTDEYPSVRDAHAEERAIRSTIGRNPSQYVTRRSMAAEPPS